ncbi:MAG: DUF2062 domain-containing protein [Pikeienuella sp.]
MVFKRRDKPSIGSRLRALLAPRKGWRRGLEYLGHRVQRLPGSPESIAIGFACGVYTSFTPFFGLHFLFAAAFAWLFRANIMASAIGTFFGNPVTFPVIAVLSLKIGNWALGVEGETDTSFTDLGFWEMFAYFLQNISDLVPPYLVGGLFPGLVCAFISFLLIRPLVRTYQARRRAKLAALARKRLARAAAKTAAAE